MKYILSIILALFRKRSKGYIKKEFMLLEKRGNTTYNILIDSIDRCESYKNFLEQKHVNYIYSIEDMHTSKIIGYVDEKEIEAFIKSNRRITSETIAYAEKRKRKRRNNLKNKNRH